MLKPRQSAILFGIPLLLLVVYLIGRLSRPTNSQVAREGEAAVVAFLQEGADGAFSDFGQFIELTGEGFYTPVWNIQGYYYLGLNRTARFTSNNFNVRIFIEGNQKVDQITRPKVEGPLNPRAEVVIRVSHPALYQR